MLLSLLWFLLNLLLSMGGVAFITLLERKLLGLSQIRLGPNKVTFYGLLQPVADGVKLLGKNNFIVLQNYIFMFSFSPSLVLLMFFIMWLWVIPWAGSGFLTKYASFLFFAMLGLGAYAVILTGWSSMSSFSKLGSVRGMLQSLSFEVTLILFFMILLCFFGKFNLSNLIKFNLELLTIWVLLWLFLSLMETNRAPFDLLEGESELISGFNIEMGSLMFVFLFLGEYGMIIVMSLMSGILFGNFMILMVTVFYCFIIFMRSCFPRVRYDVMMTMMWKLFLPVSILLFFHSSLLK